MSRGLSSAIGHDSNAIERAQPGPVVVTRSSRLPEVFLFAAWHSLLWLVLSNAIGGMLAALLLLPQLDNLLGDWSYGRWLPVHMTLQLYGWASLPLVAFLFKVY